MRWLTLGLSATLLLQVSASGDYLTTTEIVREPGRCSIYGECGKKSAFGSQLPCPDNGLARVVSSLAQTVRL